MAERVTTTAVETKDTPLVSFRFFRWLKGTNHHTIDVIASNKEFLLNNKFIDVTRLTRRGDGIQIREMKDIEHGYISGASQINVYSKNLTAIYLLYALTGNGIMLLSMFDNINKTVMTFQRNKKLPRVTLEQLTEISSSMIGKYSTVKHIPIPVCY